MNNLIVTIIGIALTAVAAVMGIFYGGTAYENAQMQAIFNAWTSQNTQILQAAQLFSFDHGGTDVVPMCGLYNGKYLSSWPNFVNGAPSPYGFPPNQGALMTTMGFEGGCWAGNGNAGELDRMVLGYKGNLVEWTFLRTGNFVGYCTPTLPTQLDVAAAAKSLPVQLAILFNKSNYSNLPSGLTMSASGLPEADASWTVTTATDMPNSGCSGSPPQPNLTPTSGQLIYLDSTGKIMTGCILGDPADIYCFQMQ